MLQNAVLWDRIREGAGAASPLAGGPGSVAAATDPFLTGINDELADKGFLVTTTDDLINWA
ncbi:MAG: hypothetical protein K2Y05_05605, partial [Hyphomicrobiaceae bacterium]|nr:hypothetical protein [Hyphomicrobiaceae bacterium]